MTDQYKTHSQTIRDDILSYREMCDQEGLQTLQRGMNYRIKPDYSIVLMSQRSNAPYKDKVHEDGVTIEYEGHDAAKRSPDHNPKIEDQPAQLPSGKLTQNGYFIDAVERYKSKTSHSELVKVYEKIMSGVWSLKGVFELIDYAQESDEGRSVYKFQLKLAHNQEINLEPGETSQSHSRVIPSEVKKHVWQRDKGRCVLCHSTENLHFDHDLPYSKGGTSLSVDNVRLLCMKHNLEKSANIE